MKKAFFRSLSEAFYLGKISIINDVDKERFQRYLEVMDLDGFTGFTKDSVVRIIHQRDPDRCYANYAYYSDIPTYKFSDVLLDMTRVEKLSSAYDALYTSLSKINNPVLRELAKRNIDFDFALGRLSLDRIQEQTEAHEALQVAFSWIDTEEGVLFWSLVQEIEAKGGEATGFSEFVKSLLQALDIKVKVKRDEHLNRIKAMIAA